MDITFKGLPQYQEHNNVFYDKDSNTFIKLWYSRQRITRWWSIYKDYQSFDERAVQVVDINFNEGYFVMEAVSGHNLYQEMILLNFEEKKKILLETMDIFHKCFEFQSKALNKKEVWFHADYRTENLIYSDQGILKLVDPDSFIAVPLSRMNNLLFFGKYMDTLNSIKERLSFEELTDTQVMKLGKGYLYD